MTIPQSGQRYRLSHRGSTNPSKQACTNPCPHTLPLHRGHREGLGQGNSLPISKIILTQTSTRSIKRAHWLLGGTSPRLFPWEGCSLHPSHTPHPKQKSLPSEAPDNAVLAPFRSSYREILTPLQIPINRKPTHIKRRCSTIVRIMGLDLVLGRYWTKRSWGR